MAVPRDWALAVLVVLCCNAFLPTSLASSSDDFVGCLTGKIPREHVVLQSSRNFMSELSSSVQNPRLLTNTTVRPFGIITASKVSHVQYTVLCGRRHGVRLRVRSGGHDYEGLSYRSVRAEVFAVLDLARLRAVRVSRRTATAWADSGATLGELYYAVGNASPTLAFPAGACPTVGVGGFLSGGGIGMLMRRFGTGADNVLDAKIVNADGELLDRAAMGEDLFWAIRGGGGGGSFGVVVSWKLKLAEVPRTVTVSNITKTVGDGAAAAVAKWETAALGTDLTVRVLAQGSQALFQVLFLGDCPRLVKTLRAALPELGFTAANCHEVSWLRAMAFLGIGHTDVPVEGILNRTNNLQRYVKNKSDYVRRAVGEAGWGKIFRRHLCRNGEGVMILEPQGGVVGSAVADSATPYPHRRGVLYNIQYVVFWRGGADGREAAVANRWLNGLYRYMEPLVSSNPREAYINYRDLDLGVNVVGRDGVTTYESGKVWGEKYFMGNFKRLAVTKGKVDPGDYFRNEQSIPPLLAKHL